MLVELGHECVSRLLRQQCLRKGRTMTALYFFVVNSDYFTCERESHGDLTVRGPYGARALRNLFNQLSRWEVRRTTRERCEPRVPTESAAGAVGDQKRIMLLPPPKEHAVSEPGRAPATESSSKSPSLKGIAVPKAEAGCQRKDEGPAQHPTQEGAVADEPAEATGGAVCLAEGTLSGAQSGQHGASEEAGVE